MKPAAWIALALACLAGVFVLALRQGPEPSGTASAPVPVSGPDLRRELEALRAENAGLRKRLAASGNPAPDSAPLPVPAPSGELPSPDLLLVRAKAALLARDSVAFVEAFLALLDCGDAGAEAVLSLVEEGGLPRLYRDLDPEAAERINRGFILRSARLGALLDRALLRSGSSKHALGFVLHLYGQGIEAAMPREEQVRILLAQMRKEAETGDGRGGMLHQLSEVLLARLKASEALPDVERMFSSIPENSRWSLAYALGRMNRPESLALLKRMLSTASGTQARSQLLGALWHARGPEANALLWELEASEQDPDCRQQIVQALAARAENLDRILAKVRDPESLPRDRQAMLWGVLQASQGREEVRESLWRLYDAEPEHRDLILGSALQYRDPKAVRLFLDRLTSGQVGENLVQQLQLLDPRELRANLGAVEAVLSSPSLSLQARGSAYLALSRADAPAAVRSFLAGYERLSEEQRSQSIHIFLSARTPEGRAAVQGIAANDPSEAVRLAAAAALQQWK